MESGVVNMSCLCLWLPLYISDNDSDSLSILFVYKYMIIYNLYHVVCVLSHARKITDT